MTIQLNIEEYRTELEFIPRRACLKPHSDAICPDDGILDQPYGDYRTIVHNETFTVQSRRKWNMRHLKNRFSNLSIF